MRSDGTGKSKPTRGPKPSLSTEEIARTAIRVADDEGLGAVTMQRLAREVGLTTMAIYRYFPGKAEVVAAMIDSVADVPAQFGRPSSSWNLRLKEWAHRCLAIYQDHAWFLEATTVRETQMGPNELSWMEAALAMLAESGLKPRERHHAFLAVIGHVRGHATFQQIRRSSRPAGAWVQQLEEQLQPGAARYPNLLSVLRSGAFTGRIEGAFEFGLDCILDGICARAGKQSR